MMSAEEMRELDAWIAEHLFAWEWWERNALDPENKIPVAKALFPPEDGHHIRWNFSKTIFRRALPGTPKFSDWDLCGSAYDAKEGKSIPPYGVPHYTTDMGQAMIVQAAVAKLFAFGITIQSVPNGWNVRAAVSGRNEGEAPTLELAIAIFAKKVFEAKMTLRK